LTCSQIWLIPVVDDGHYGYNRKLKGGGKTNPKKKKKKTPKFKIVTAYILFSTSAEK
jgi:hypothetical protein